jgi:UDP-glucose 4-epimerase
VTIYDSLDPDCGGNVANLDGIESHVEVIRGDIRSGPDVASALRGQDVVFNCAARTSHPRSMADPLADIDVNCKGTITVLEAARTAVPAPTFVQVGTATQIGRMLNAPVTEQHPEYPLEIYSANKVAAEKYVLIYGAAYGLSVRVLRLGNVYGPRAKITDPGLGFVNYFVGLALQNKALTVFGDGRQRRTMTFVADAVDALVAAALSDACRGRVLFATSEDQHTVAEIAEVIVKEIGAGRIERVDWPKERLVTEVGDAVISSARIRQLLDWQASTTLVDGMKETRAYFRPRLARYL